LRHAKLFVFYNKNIGLINSEGVACLGITIGLLKPYCDKKTGKILSSLMCFIMRRINNIT